MAADSVERRLGPGATEAEEDDRFKEMGMEVVYGPIHDRNIGAAKRLLEIVLPVTYDDRFFMDILKVPEELRLMQYAQGLLVGVGAARLELRPDKRKRVHIMLLAVLAAYRGRGLGSSLVRQLVRVCTVDPAEEVVEAFLHVQKGNDDAVALYKSLGFELCDEPTRNYYTGVEEKDALLLRRWIGTGDADFSVNPKDFEPKEEGSGEGSA